MVNYYELLGISNDADTGTIQKAIRENRRLWNNRANSPDAAIRSEAERHVKEIADAEKILLDATERRSYDERLRQAPADNFGSTDTAEDSYVDPYAWEEDFFEAYNNGVYDVAASIADEATRVNGKDGGAWYLSGISYISAGKPLDAIPRLKMAVTYNTGDEDAMYALGLAYFNYELYEDAYKTFMNAIQIDTTDFRCYLYMAKCCRRTNQTRAALNASKRAYELEPGNTDVRWEYFVNLYDDVKNAISYNRNAGWHLITNKTQLDYVNNALKIMSAVVLRDDRELMADMDEIVRLVADAESTKGGGILRAGKPGYQYNYEVSDNYTRSSGLH